MELLGTIWFWTLAALGFGFVIFIHELGHFLFAKWAGVRVDRFSIGFGPVIFRKQIGETEYALSLLPLGGYVKMLGQEDLPSEVSGEAKVDPRSYLSKSWKWQSLILLGGVLFNLISSYIILLGIAWYGKPTIEPVVGAMMAEVRDAKGHAFPSAAVRLGLRQGDRILSINGEKIRDFDSVQMAVISNGREPIVMQVERRDAQGQKQMLRLPTEGPGIAPDPDFNNGRLTLGIQPILGTVIVGAVSASGTLPPDAPRVGEFITAIAGKEVPTEMNGQELYDVLQPHVGSTVELTIKGSSTRTVTMAYAGNVLDPFFMTGFPVRIGNLSPGSDADGLQPGDIVVSVNGQPVAGSTGFIGKTRASLASGTPIAIRVWRDGAELDLSVRGRDVHGRRLLGAGIEPVMGFMPVLPNTFDGKASPLVEAGIKPGDAIIEVGKPKNTQNYLASFEVATVSGGTRVLIPVDKQDAVAIDFEKRAGLIDKLTGGVQPSLLKSLVGRKVTATNDGVLALVTRDGSAVTISPRAISENGWSSLLKGLAAKDWIIGLVPLADGGFALEVMRGASDPVSHTITPRDPGTAILHEPLAMRTYQLESWTEAFSIANSAAYTMIVKTLQIIPRFFQSAEQGGLDPNKSLTGPIGIFSMLKGSVERFGFIKYLELMALIGLNLFLINLLPIPVTDGGQLLFLAIETATGKPLAPWARNIAMWIGLAMVASLMVYVIGLDVLRLSGVM
jgi:regulator of sigma E protease